MANTVYTKDLVTTMAYLLGVDQNVIDMQYGDTNGEQIAKLKDDKAATIIRYLCRLKTKLMFNFRKTDMEITNNLQNLDRLPYYNKEEIQWLENNGISIIQVNHKAAEYIDDFSQLIIDNFPNCKPLFKDWLNFGYIKELFCIPARSKRKGDFFKTEFDKFMGNYKVYPYQMYMYWNEPTDEGNVLYNDGRFLDFLYGLHGETFTDESKYKDANENVKKSIYDFIKESGKVSLVVDCENSNVFKLYSVLKGLDPEEMSKVNNIILYDDYHTTKVWNLLHKYLRIPVEHIDSGRITDRKSLVDMRLAVGVCKEFYTNNTDSFILVSSDSDYWGLISSLPDANFLVMYEDDKCGREIKYTLGENGIYSCSIDDFCSVSTDDFKKTLLLETLQSYLPNLLEYNGKELAKKIYEDTQISATDKEIEVFYKQYIKTLRLKCDANGNFSIEIDTY